MSDLPQDTLQQLVERPTSITINLAALKRNAKAIMSKAKGVKVLASVKADAYGHGLTQCCKALAEVGIDYFGVAFVEEGVLLREAGIKTPILIFGGLDNHQIETMLQYDLDITASSVDKLLAIDSTAKKLSKTARVHLKIDTGMERIGTHYYSAEKLFEAAKEVISSQVVGLYSHFATADSADLSFARTQLERFKQVTDEAKSFGLEPMLHMANSGAMLQLPESYFDMIRPGLSLFGCYPESHLSDRLDLEPVLRLVSKVVYFKVVKKGSSVSYGGTWTAERDTRVVTVPIGYGDGFTRANSNKGSVLIRGKRYPIIGAVCMDQLMVDIGDDEAYNGDEVVLIGKQGNECITAEEVADVTGTIPYEILCALKWRIPRIYCDDNL